MVMGTSASVGPCILQAAGAGYSFKLLKWDRVASPSSATGAVNNGAFHGRFEPGQYLEASRTFLSVKPIKSPRRFRFPTRWDTDVEAAELLWNARFLVDGTTLIAVHRRGRPGI